MLISFLHATFMKIGENDSAHQLSKMLHASSKFDFIYLIFFDDLHLQIIESISPIPSVREFISPVGYFFNPTIKKFSYLMSITKYEGFNGVGHSGSG